MQCIGLENGLSNCVHSEDASGCDQSLVAGAVCSNEDVPQTDLRLSNSPTEFKGRLEILFAGVWGEVCFSGWGPEEGDVACRQLGFRSSIESLGISQPPGSIFWLSGVNCGGSESTLAHCSHDGWGGGGDSCITSVWLNCGGNVSQSKMVNVTPHSEIPIAC